MFTVYCWKVFEQMTAKNLPSFRVSRQNKHEKRSLDIPKFIALPSGVNPEHFCPYLGLLSVLKLSDLTCSNSLHIQFKNKIFGPILVHIPTKFVIIPIITLNFKIFVTLSILTSRLSFLTSRLFLTTKNPFFLIRGWC